MPRDRPPSTAFGSTLGDIRCSGKRCNFYFDYYDGDKKVIEGAKALGKLKSTKELAGKKRSPIWPKDKPVVSPVVQKLGAGKVSDGSW